MLSREGDGYWLTDDEQRRLEEIDERLKQLLPADDHQLVTSVTPTNEATTCQVRHC